MICDQITELSCVAKTNRQKIRDIWIFVPGISNENTGKVWAPNIPGWKSYPLREEILTHVPDKKLPSKLKASRSLHSRRNAATRGQELSQRNFLAMGTGIGAGILVDGTILRGANDIAGAIGCSVKS